MSAEDDYSGGRGAFSGLNVDQFGRDALDTESGRRGRVFDDRLAYGGGRWVLGAESAGGYGDFLRVITTP